MSKLTKLMLVCGALGIFDRPIGFGKTERVLRPVRTKPELNLQAERERHNAAVAKRERKAEKLRRLNP